MSHLEALEGRLEVRVVPRTSETVTLKLYSVRPLGLTETLRTLQNLGLTVTEELQIPLALPEGRKVFLYRFEIEAAPERIAALLSGEERFATALRALDEERATDDPLNGLVLPGRARLARGRGAAHAAQPPAADPPPLQRRDRERRAAAQQPAWPRALFRVLRRALRPRACGDRAQAMRRGAEGRAAGPGGRPQPGRGRGPARARQPHPLRAAHQLLPAARAAGRRDQGRQPQGRGHALAAAACSRSTSTRAAARGHPPARRQGGARRHPLERPPRRLPHRDPGPDEDPDGQERDHRARGLARAASCSRASVPPRPALDAYLVDRYREFVSGLLDVTDNIVDGKVAPSARGGAPRRRRSLPGGRGRQGHRPPLRHRQQRLGAVRLLARRRLRLRRQRRLRPQEGRHHRARRLGVREAPLPEPGRRRPEGALHHGRRSATWRATSSATACCS